MSNTTGAVIATAKFEYTQDGLLESATLWPKISVTKDELLGQMGDCKNRSLEELKNCAQLMLGSFFTKVSDIELRDMEKTTLDTNVSFSSTHDNGNIKEVEFEFIYKQN